MTDHTPLDPAKRRLITASAMLATMMVAVDSTIANVALPHIQAGMSASQDQAVWVLTSYLIASAIATPLSAWLASRFGRKRVMVLSVAGFTLASAACGAAASLPMLVAARMVQGASGAGLVPLSQAMLLDINPPKDHGKAMALYGTGSMFGPLIGPTLGGWLTDAFSWRWCFLINLPLGVLSLLGMALFMRETRAAHPVRFDMFGFASLSVFLGAFQLVLDRGQTLGWLDSTELRIEAAIMVMAGYQAVVHMLTAPGSFVRPQIFKDRNFVLGCLVSASIGVVSFAAIPLVVVMMQQILGYPAMLTGMVSSPRGVGTLISMLMVGRLIGRFDPRYFLITGLVLTATGLYLLAHLSLMVGQSSLLVAGLFQGLGSGLLFVPLSTLVFSTLAPAFRNEGAALYALTRNMGASLGISFLQTRTIENTAIVQSRLTEGIRPDNPLLGLRMPDLDFGSARSLIMMDGSLAHQAVMVAYVDMFWMLCLIALAMIPVVLLLRPPRHRPLAEPLPMVD